MQSQKTTTVKQDTGGDWKSLSGSPVTTVKQDVSGGYKTVSGRPISASQVVPPKQIQKRTRKTIQTKQPPSK